MRSCAPPKARFPCWHARLLAGLCLACGVVVTAYEGIGAGERFIHPPAYPMGSSEAMGASSSRAAEPSHAGLRSALDHLRDASFLPYEALERCAAEGAGAQLAPGTLPGECGIVFGSREFWRTYSGPVAVLGAVVLLQAGLLWGLLWQRRRRQRAEEDAQQRRTEIAHAARLSVMGVLAASIAHEINQPLGAILSNADAADMILDQEQPDLDELRAIVRDIRADDLRASEVIRGMRVLLRKRELHLEKLDVNAEVLAAIHHLRSDATRRRIRIVQDFGGNVPAIAGDAVHLQQVLINLVVNAMEAMESTPEREREVHVQTRACRGGAEIVVRDHGPGIPAGDAGRLFESFFTTKAEGTGLGLSIVRAIIDAHRGIVSADAGSSRGAIFRVWLPASAS